MTITHQISSDPTAPLTPGTNITNQLSGMLGQAAALLSSGVGLPGMQSIGTQIAAMSGAITTAGGAAGIDTSSASLSVSALGSQLAGITSLTSATAIIASLNSVLSSLTSLLNPAGGGASIIHSHILDASNGISHSAFNGQHIIKLMTDGINLMSKSKVSSTAPVIPHNGLTLVSDALQVSKIVTGAGFGLISDRRLKENINDHPAVLEDVLKLRLKTFDVKTVDWETKACIGDTRPSLGLIAQEVQKLFPLLVRDDGFLTLEEGKIGMLLLGAFQEFVMQTRAEITDLRKQIIELKR